MLIQFEVSNYLSFNEKETFSMIAGKSRQYSDRIYWDNKSKITKCKVILGANASGKSNMISAIQFMQNMVLSGLPRGFSNKYFRLCPEKRNMPSEFRIMILCGVKIFLYGFSVILSTGCILKEYLYECTNPNSKKYLFQRDTTAEIFTVGQYFKQSEAIAKLYNYGEDCVNDREALFISIINRHKGKMFSDYPELQILQNVFDWFGTRLNISFPDSILTGYPYFTDLNLDEIAELLNALGTGISELKIVQIPTEIIKNKVPHELYDNIVCELERANARRASDNSERPKIMARSYKEFYTFEIDPANNISVTTIEFSHEKENVYFELNEESDGTARLLDLIEILLKISNSRIFVIDEIDRCLHPAVTVKVVELFLRMAEKRNTQLIITSHESRLLDTDLLRNDEICFVTKDSNGASDIIPLEKCRLRADKKLYAALFDGTLEAVPVFNKSKLSAIIDRQSLD